jgi:hypothetical protein
VGFTTVPDKTDGDVFTAAMWDTHIKDNFNTGVPVLFGSTTLLADTAQVTFAAIPQTHQHLWIDWYGRISQAAVSGSIHLQINDDASAQYDSEYINALGATASAGEFFAVSNGETTGMLCPGASAAANLFAGGSIIIPHYTGGSNQKSGVTTAAAKYGTSSGQMETRQVGWTYRSTSAITQLEFIAGGGSNLVTGSRFSLFGMP